MRLSIIIPAYNADKYLERCVSSCEEQNIPPDEFEIIVVNDGSKDNTWAVAEFLADKYCNVRIFSKENGGSSSARNMGMDNAVGDYITFVDSDDYLLDGKLGSVLSITEKNKLNMCIFNLKVMSLDGSFVITKNPLKREKIYNCEDAFIEGYQVGSACGKLYLRKMLESNNIRFRTDIVFGEDSYFSFQVLLKCRRMMNADVCAYVYAANPQSVTKGTYRLRDKEIRRCEDSLQLIKLVSQQLEDKTISDRFRKYLKNFASSLYFGFLMSLIGNKNFSYRDARNLISKAKSIHLYPNEVTSSNLVKAIIMHVLNIEFILNLILRLKLNS